MVRPRRRRRIGWKCKFTHITPVGPGIIHLEETILTHEGLEALRLKDFQGLNQKKAAEEMEVSQPTFHRLLIEARKKVADALVNNKIIKIGGGNYKMEEPKVKRPRGRFGGPPQYCVCPDCGNRENKVPGIPCRQTVCKKCATLMVRE